MRTDRFGHHLLVVALGLGLLGCQGEGAPVATVGPNSAGGALAVDVTASATSGTAPLAVTFAANARGGRAPYQFSWSFGDGSGSSEQSPVKIFGAGGAFRVAVTVTSGEERATSATVTINVDAGVRLACFLGPNDGIAPHEVSVRAVATGGTGDFSYLWNFGDGALAGGSDFQHVYGAPGTYTITGTATSGGVRASCSDTVRVYERLINHCRGFSATGPAPLNVAFVAMANYCEDAGCHFTWDFGDGTSAAGKGLMRPEHTYTVAGNYDAVVLVQTGSARDSCSVAVAAQVP